MSRCTWESKKGASHSDHAAKWTQRKQNYNSIPRSKYLWPLPQEACKPRQKRSRPNLTRIDLPVHRKQARRAHCPKWCANDNRPRGDTLNCRGEIRDVRPWIGNSRYAWFQSASSFTNRLPRPIQAVAQPRWAIRWPRGSWAHSWSLHRFQQVHADKRVISWLYTLLTSGGKPPPCNKNKSYERQKSDQWAANQLWQHRRCNCGVECQNVRKYWAREELSELVRWLRLRIGHTTGLP